MVAKKYIFSAIVLLQLARISGQDIVGSGGQVVGTLTNALTSWISNSSNVEALQEFFLNPNGALAQLAGSGQVLSVLKASEQTVSGDCLQHMMMFVQALTRQEDWALRMVDAIGKPPSGLMNYKLLWLGDWEECTNTEATVYQNFTLKSKPSHPFSGQYCSVSFPITISGFLWSSAAMFTVGACFPNTCSSSDATTVANLLMDLLPSDLGNFSVPDPQVNCKEKHLPLDGEAITVIVVCSIFLTLMTFATVYDVVYVHWVAKMTDDRSNSGNDENIEEGHHGTDMNVIQDKSDGVNGTVEFAKTTEPTSTSDIERSGVQAKYTEQKTKHGVLEGLVLSFSVLTNGTKILNTRQPTGAIRAVNGIRFLTLSWVIVGHGFGVTSGPWIDNALQYGTGLIKRREFTVIYNGTFSVDTFFLLSGLLVSYLSLREMEKRKGIRGFKWIMFYFHRFWRLTPPYMMLLMLYVTLEKYIANGPLWPQDGFDDATSCRKEWWRNLLYINNLVKTDGPPRCIAWTWYLANDMQFYVISPLVLIPMYYSKILGGLACLALLLTSTVSSGVISWYYELAIPTTFDPENQDAFNWYYYVKPWCRVGPYAVGLFTGYMLHRTKLKMKINRVVNVLMWTLSIALGCLIIYGIYTPDKTSPPLSPNMDAFYNATARSAWGACVAWVIFACAHGYGGPVNHLLSWPGFVPLGRLTYFAYLCHIILMQIYHSSQLSVVTAYDYGVVYFVLGHMCMSFGASFLLSLAFEAPMMGLEKVLLGREKHS